MREWQGLAPINRTLTLSVNLSGKQLAQPDLIEQVERILQKTDLDPRSLKLEITESVVMENAETAATMLGQLRALGVNLSIDDFGTGYSSLSYLHRFPVNTLKVDRSFVGRIGWATRIEIVRTIIPRPYLGWSVAEGVETEEQLAHLKRRDANMGRVPVLQPLSAEAQALHPGGGQKQQ